MPNMGYVRFQNTAPDLEDCAEHIHDDLSEDEERARKRLIRACREIVAEVGAEDDD